MTDEDLEKRVKALEKKVQKMSGYLGTTPVVDRRVVDDLELRVTELERRLDDIQP